MYKWQIDILLKNGKNVSGVYEGEEANSLDVGKALLSTKIDAIGLTPKDNASHLFVVRTEIATMTVSIFK